MIDRVRSLRVTAVVYGVVAGLLAVGVQIFFSVQPPPAYAICMACHPRDMVSWLFNNFFGANWEIAPVSVLFPLLTTVGVLIGAFIAAYRHKEIRWISLGKNWQSFIYGLLVMNGAAVRRPSPPIWTIIFHFRGTNLSGRRTPAISTSRLARTSEGKPGKTAIARKMEKFSGRTISMLRYFMKVSGLCRVGRFSPSILLTTGSISTLNTSTLPTT